MVLVLLGHDAHKGNLRLFRAITESAPSNVIVWSSRCCMHQLQLALSVLYKSRGLSFHNPLFCLCKLVHQGTYMKRLRELMHKALDAKFRVVYTRPCPDATEWSRRFLDLVYVRAGAD